VYYVQEHRLSNLVELPLLLLPLPPLLLLSLLLPSQLLLLLSLRSAAITTRTLTKCVQPAHFCTVVTGYQLTAQPCRPGAQRTANGHCPLQRWQRPACCAKVIVIDKTFAATGPQPLRPLCALLHEVAQHVYMPVVACYGQALIEAARVLSGSANAVLYHLAHHFNAAAARSLAANVVGEAITETVEVFKHAHVAIAHSYRAGQQLVVAIGDQVFSELILLA
jgi:hypothetical protein